MYLKYYNLKKEPFNVTPDPDLLFLSPSHKEALGAVIYGVNGRKGFVSITGEVGVGKTTIIRSFLDRVSLLGKDEKGKIRIIYIFNANTSFKALLKALYKNLGRTASSDDESAMVDELHGILIDEYKAGRNVVLIIDEAQNMPVETLENLRMLSNLETSTDKLIQVVFCGQPEFEEKINRHVLRQLKQRIAVRVRIMPLTRKESLGYIDHRLSKALVTESELFTRGALYAIVNEAGGIPRIINILCDNCLITSFGNQQKKVSARVAREIISDIRREGKSRPWWHTPLLIAMIGVAGVVWAAALRGLLVAGSAIPVHPPTEMVLTTENIQPPQNAPRGTVEEQPRKADNVPGPAGESTVFKRVAKRGDTLAGLIRDTYGAADRELISLVKRSNPGIANVDKIQEGQEILFPERNR